MVSLVSPEIKRVMPPARKARSDAIGAFTYDAWEGRDLIRRSKLAIDPSSIMNPGLRRRGQSPGDPQQGGTR
jgi:hypothetical protein